MTEALHRPDGLDISRPSPARIYDYMLRGSHISTLTRPPPSRSCAWSRNQGLCLV